MIWARRRQEQDDACDKVSHAVPALAEAVDAVQAHGRQALDWLIDRLLTVDETGDAALARAALGVLQAKPWVVARLDEHARRVWWWSEHHKPVFDRAARRLRNGTAGPVAVVLATSHRDGRVRERAVERILARPDSQQMPFLVLRTADWVKPVRDRARAGLALLLADDPETYLPAVLGMTLAVRPRHWLVAGVVAAADAGRVRDGRARRACSGTGRGSRVPAGGVESAERHPATFDPPPAPSTGPRSASPIRLSVRSLGSPRPSQADAPELGKLLIHRAPRVRAQALRALRQLDAVPIEQTIRMLRDPSPSVVREAMLRAWLAAAPAKPTDLLPG